MLIEVDLREISSTVMYRTENIFNTGTFFQSDLGAGTIVNHPIWFATYLMISHSKYPS